MSRHRGVRAILSPEKRKALDNLGEQVTREVKSQQEQYQKGFDPNEFFWSTMSWVCESIDEEPPYVLDSRARDKWLRNLWPQEPYLAGIIKSAVLIDANRGWTLVGGRNQVNRYVKMIHNLSGGKGYRTAIREMGLAFRTSDICTIAEIARDDSLNVDVENPPPLRDIYPCDPCQFCLTGKPEKPLRYYPAKGRPKYWGKNDYFRVVSMPSTDATLYDLGWSGVSMAYELARVSIGVLGYDQEKLLARGPEGFMFLEGITENQWNNAMVSRDAQLTQKERKYFGDTFIFAAMQKIGAQLVSLKSMPDQFDRQTFTDLLMYAYALIFGYPADEFWPVRFGALGRGTEAEMGHRKATSKGPAEFPVMFQEEFQRNLPDTLLFEYDERDVEGEIADSELQKQKIDNIIALYTKQKDGSPGLIEYDEGRQLLVQEGIIPPSWTSEEEIVTVTSEETQARTSRYLQLDIVQRAARKKPDEPIVRYHWPDGTMRLLVDRGDLLTKNRTFSIPRRIKVRQDNEQPTVLYQNGEVTITDADIDQAVQEGLKRTGKEFYDLLTAKEKDEG